MSRAADRRALEEAVAEAAEAVMGRFKAPMQVGRKSDGSPLTEADLIADHILRTRLMGHAPGYGWLSEESRRTPAAEAGGAVWVVDPIDGTRAFARGGDDFAVCGALIEDGKAVLSVVAAPARKETYVAEAGAGATRNGERIRASENRRLDGARVFGQERMFAHPAWPRAWPALRVSNPNSTNLRAALAGAGEADAVLALFPKADWDAAPGALIAREAGLAVTDHLGEAHRYARPEARQRSLLVATPGLHGELLSRLAHLPADLTTVAPKR